MNSSKDQDKCFLNDLKIDFLFIVFFCGALFSVSSFVSAESTVEAGLDRVDENIVLSDTNPREAAIRIINLALTFLGILAVGIVPYDQHFRVVRIINIQCKFIARHYPI